MIVEGWKGATEYKYAVSETTHSLCGRQQLSTDGERALAKSKSKANGDKQKRHRVERQTVRNEKKKREKNDW